MIDKQINSLILSIYDATADASLWPVVLDRCAEFTGARSCAIFEYDSKPKKQPFHISHMCGSFPEKRMYKYVNGQIRQEKLDRLAAKRVTSSLDNIEALSDEIVYSDYSEFLNRSNVQALKSIGLRHRVIAFLSKDNLDTAQFTLQYQDGRGPATQQELARLNTILPHLAKAIDLGRPSLMLNSREGSFFTALDLLNIGVCILSSQGTVVHSNVEFQRQLEELAGFSVTIDGVLRFSRQESQSTFNKLMSNVRQHGKFGARPRKEVLTVNEDDHLCVEMTTLTKSRELGSQPHKGFLLFSIDTTKPLDFDPAALGLAFNLTDTEKQLVTLIASGMTNAQISELRERSITTINTQVKSIFAKCGVHSRVQFIRVLFSYGATVFTRY